MTKVIISIPTPLRSYTNNQKKIEVKGNTIFLALENLMQQYPKLTNHIFDGQNLRNFVNIYLNEEDMRYLADKELTTLNDGDQLAIIPSIAGGI